MTTDLERQLRQYTEFLDGTLPEIAAEQVLLRRVDPVVVSLIEPPGRRRLPRLAWAAVAAVAMLAAIALPLLFLSRGAEPDVATTVPVTTVPETETTVPVTTVPEVTVPEAPEANPRAITIPDLPSAMEEGWEWVELPELDGISDSRPLQPRIGRLADGSWMLSLTVGRCIGPDGETSNSNDHDVCPEGTSQINGGWARSAFWSNDLVTWRAVDGLVLAPWGLDPLLDFGITRTIDDAGVPGDWVRLESGSWTPLPHLTQTLSELGFAYVDELGVAYVDSVHTAGAATLITSSPFEMWLTDTFDASVAAPTLAPALDPNGTPSYFSSKGSWYRLDWTGDAFVMSMATEPGVWSELGTVTGLPERDTFRVTQMMAFAGRFLLVAEEGLRIGRGASGTIVSDHDAFYSVYASRDGLTWEQVSLPQRANNSAAGPEPYIGLAGTDEWLRVRFVDSGFMVTPDLETWYQLEGPPRFRGPLGGYSWSGEFSSSMSSGAMVFLQYAECCENPAVIWPGLIVVAPEP